MFVDYSNDELVAKINLSFGKYLSYCMFLCAQKEIAKRIIFITTFSYRFPELKELNETWFKSSSNTLFDLATVICDAMQMEECLELSLSSKKILLATFTNLPEKITDKFNKHHPLHRIYRNIVSTRDAILIKFTSKNSEKLLATLITKKENTFSPFITKFQSIYIDYVVIPSILNTKEYCCFKNAYQLLKYFDLEYHRLKLHTYFDGKGERPMGIVFELLKQQYKPLIYWGESTETINTYATLELNSPGVSDILSRNV